MSEYLGGLILIAALAAFGELMSYSGGESGTHKFAVSVILLYSLIAPLIPLVENMGELDFSLISGDGEALEGGAYLEIGEEAFTEGIKRAVSQKWGLDEGKIVVTAMGFDFQNMRAERIMITLLLRGAMLDFREIENYIENSGLGECEVSYAFE